MSDAPQGPGWWQASDMKWYPPEAAPGAQPTAPQAPQAPQQPFQPLGPPATAKPAVALKPQQIILMATGVVTLIASFGPVWTAGSGAFSTSWSSWDSLFRSFTFLVLLAIATSAVTALETFGVLQLPKKLLGFTMNQLAFFVGVYGTLISLAALISTESGASVGWGGILILLASIGTIVGAVLALKEDGAL